MQQQPTLIDKEGATVNVSAGADVEAGMSSWTAESMPFHVDSAPMHLSMPLPAQVLTLPRTMLMFPCAHFQPYLDFIKGKKC